MDRVSKNMVRCTVPEISLERPLEIGWSREYSEKKKCETKEYLVGSYARGDSGVGGGRSNHHGAKSGDS